MMAYAIKESTYNLCNGPYLVKDSSPMHHTISRIIDFTITHIVNGTLHKGYLLVAADQVVRIKCFIERHAIALKRARLPHTHLLNLGFFN